MSLEFWFWSKCKLPLLVWPFSQCLVEMQNINGLYTIKPAYYFKIKFWFGTHMPYILKWNRIFEFKNDFRIPFFPREEIMLH
jgi:hypothetical protein